MIGLMNTAGFERLIQFVFGTPTIKDFQKQKPMRFVLETFSAAVTLHQHYVIKDYDSTYQVYSFLIECS